jgi:serine O-acetyltransferase
VANVDSGFNAVDVQRLLSKHSASTHADPVSAQVADMSREALRFGKWAPSRALLSSLRRYEKLRSSRQPHEVVLRWITVLTHRFWSVVCGADIPLGSRLGGGLLLPHPNGIVIHPDAHVGVNCLIFQQVTLGAGGSRPGLPHLCGHVDVGAGAKILGGVRIGEHAVIGANSVVLQDVPAGATAVGVPARILSSRRS